jgi:hypothetical protein
MFIFQTISEKKLFFSFASETALLVTDSSTQRAATVLEIMDALLLMRGGRKEGRPPRPLCTIRELQKGPLTSDCLHLQPSTHTSPSATLAHPSSTPSPPPFFP